MSGRCEDGREGISGPGAGVLTPPHKKDKDGQPANFRLTGGGRVDKPEPQLGKNTPQSRDVATFGFQARPTGLRDHREHDSRGLAERDPRSVHTVGLHA